MTTMNKCFFSCFMFLMLTAFSARAELSANPWAEPNSSEDIEEVYGRANDTATTAQERAAAAEVYARVPQDTSSEEGILHKVKNMFRSEEKVEEKPVRAAPSVNQQEQQILARRQGLRGSKKSAVRHSSAGGGSEGGFWDGIEMPSGDFSGMLDKVKGNFKSLTDAFK